MVIDRLGYVSGDKLDGNRVCVVSRVDVAPNYSYVFDVRSSSGLAVRYVRTAVAIVAFDVAVTSLTCSSETWPAG